MGLPAEGGDHGEPATLDFCLVDTEREKFLVDGVQQMSGLTTESIARLPLRDLWKLSAVVLGFSDPPLTEHPVQDVLPSTTKCGHVFVGVESSGIVHDGGENRAFAHRHVLNRFVEVGHCSRFDSIGVSAEERDVQVVLEDLFLRHQSFEFEGKKCFLDFSFPRPFLSQESVLGVLLSDGRPTLHPWTGIKNIVHCRTRDADR